MTRNSLIIIGAGLGGLSAGCYLQMNGYHTLIFEHHSVPGGVAACWKRKGYLIDGGIHFIMGHRPGTDLHDVYRQLGAADDDIFVDLITYGRYVDERTGRSVDVTGDLDRLRSDLGELPKHDKRVVEELIRGARAMRGLDMSEIGLAKPPELTTALDQLSLLWRMRRLWRPFTGRMAASIGEYAESVQDPWLRGLLPRLFAPEVPVWFVCMLLALAVDGQIGLLKHGCLDFALRIEKRYGELGGQVQYKSTVEEVIIENNRASGVRLADGSVHSADTVVSAADGYSTVYGMLGGRYLSSELQHRYEAWPLCKPFLTVSFGVAREYPNEPAFTTLQLAEPIDVGRECAEAVIVRMLNYGPDFAPPGKTVVQVELETEWDYWNDLQCSDRRRYDEEKDRVAADVLARLERHYPGISGVVEMIDVATPYTLWRYTLNHRAAYMGWQMTPEVFRARFERTLPGLDRFYLAGQWAMGGGVNSVLYSGQHVAQLMCKRDGRRFTVAAA